MLRKNEDCPKGIAFGGKYGRIYASMGELEETSELRLDFTKLEKVGGQVSATRASLKISKVRVRNVCVSSPAHDPLVSTAMTNSRRLFSSWYSSGSMSGMLP